MQCPYDAYILMGRCQLKDDTRSTCVCDWYCKQIDVCVCVCLCTVSVLVYSILVMCLSQYFVTFKSLRLITNLYSLLVSPHGGLNREHGRSESYRKHNCMLILDVIHRGENENTILTRLTHLVLDPVFSRCKYREKQHRDYHQVFRQCLLVRL